MTGIRKQSVTRDDVARLAGVSVATVSYVLNDGPRGVKPETKAKVLKAVEELDYHPSDIARSLKTNRTLTVGLIVTDIVNPFHAAVAKAIEEEARAAGYTVIQCNSDEDSEQELTYLRMLQSKRVDGIIIVPTGSSIPYLSEMIRSGWNIVQLDRRLPEVKADSVIMDNVRGAFDAVNHLIQLGHRRIALVGAPTTLTPGQQRRQGYEQALSATGIPIEPSLICESNYKAENTLALVRDFLEEPFPGTAIFVATNLLALSVMQVIRERGLSMPNDIALCVFDDPPYYKLMAPSISAVRYAIPELARTGFQLLLEQIIEQRTYDNPKHEVVPCELVVRESTVGTS